MFYRDFVNRTDRAVKKLIHLIENYIKILFKITNNLLKIKIGKRKKVNKML